MFGCPGEVTLRRIGADALGDDTFAALEAHIDGCPACQATLERLAREGSARPGSAAAPTAGPLALPSVPGFVVERELGRGSYGVVYLAWESELERHVALKVVPGGPVAGPRGRSRWLAEARAVSRMRHPNVVRLYRVDETDEWLVLVLEYVPGGTLKDRLDGPLPPRDAAALMEEVALAVDAIHRSDLLHLDLKPSNILLDGEADGPLGRATPKISDFGIARAFGDPVEGGTGTTGLRGTPSYMAPEQAVPGGAPIGPAADVYALGAVLYHALTGRPPFLTLSVAETLDQIRHEEPVPPGRLNPRIAQDLETICLACLRKEANRRYPSARALADDLRLWLDGRAIRARPSSTAEHVVRWVRRRPAVAGLAASLAATVVASIVGLLALLARSEAARARAEESQQIASRSLREYQVWISGVLDDTEPFEEGRLQDFVRSARRLSALIERDDRLAPGLLASLGVLEQHLADKIRDRPGRLPEAQALLAESVGLLSECRRLSPGDRDVLGKLIQGVLISGDIAGHHGLLEEAERHYAEALALAGGASGDEVRSRVLFRISDSRRNHAYLQTWAGRPGPARGLLEADLRQLGGPSRSDAAAPDSLAREALDLAALGRSDRGLSIMKEVQDRPPEEWLDPADRQRLLLEWLGLEAARAALGYGGPLPREEDAASEARAAALIDTIREHCNTLVASPLDPPAVVLELARHVQVSGAARRRAGEAGEAERVERQFLILTRELVRRHPHRPESHMALSEAYIQVAKNAGRRGANHEAADALARSLAAARRALGLAPESGAARRLVDDRDRRVTQHISNSQNYH